MNPTNIMTPADKQVIQTWNSPPSDQTEITFFASGGDADAPFDAFCEAFSALAPQVKIRRKSPEDGDPSPALLLLPNLIFQAVPQGDKLPPFLHALERKETKLSPAVRESLEALRAPVLLNLYIAQHCPFCPRVLAEFAPLPYISPFLHLKIIEADRFPDAAAEDNIQSVPTLLLDDDFRWTGAIPLQEVIGMAADRDPAQLSAAALEQMIKEGNAGPLARMMIDHRKIFPALVDLLVHPKWPSRLGSMVVAETLAEEDPPLARQLTPLLWERFPHSETSVKGDILYMIGVSGGPSALPLLQSILNGDEDGAVKEAAEDAVRHIGMQVITT